MAKENDVVREAHALSVAYLNRDEQAAFIRQCRRRRKMKTLRQWAIGRVDSMHIDANCRDQERRHQDNNRRHRFKVEMARED